MITSDDMPGDPYGWVTNQCGHFCIGLVVAVVGVAIGAPILALWPVAALVYWLVSEVWLQCLALWRDALMDTFHVASGVAVAASMHAGQVWWPVAMLAVWGLVLGLGAWRRV